MPNNETQTARQDPLARNRELAQALALLEKRQEPSVLVLLGPEGIGKTHLLRRIRSHAANGSADVLVVRHEVQADGSVGMFNTLLNLRRKTSVAAEARNRKVRFLAFDLTACRYVKLTEGEAEAEKLEAALAGFSDPAYRGLILTAGKVAGNLSLGTLDDLISKGLNRALRAARKEQAFSESSAVGALHKLLAMDADELLDLLPGLLVSDIADYLGEDDSRRLMFCLDDYGKLWGQEEHQQVLPERSPRDGALRALMEGTSGAVFVITDRSEAFWKGRKGDGSSAAYVLVPLQAFKDDQCHSYLELSGLPKSLRDGVVHQSHGFPVWLKLAMQQYNLLTQRGETVTPAALSHEGKDIIGIVRVGLNQQELETLKNLASALWFDRPLFEALVAGDVPTGYPASAMDEFVKLSFVEELGRGTYAIRDAFRYPLQQWLQVNAALLLARLGNIRHKHLESRGLLGASMLALEAHDAIYQAGKRLQSGQESPEEFLRKLDQTFANGNPGEPLRKSLTGLQQKLQSLQATFARTEEAFQSALVAGPEVGQLDHAPAASPEDELRALQRLLDALPEPGEPSQTDMDPGKDSPK